MTVARNTFRKNFARQFSWWLPRWALLVAPAMGIAAAADLNDSGDSHVFPATMLAMLVYLLIVLLATSLSPALADGRSLLGRALRTGTHIRILLSLAGLCLFPLGYGSLEILTLAEISCADRFLEFAGGFSRHLGIDLFSLLNSGPPDDWSGFTITFVVSVIFATVQVFFILLLAFLAAIYHQWTGRKKFTAEAAATARDSAARTTA